MPHSTRKRWGVLGAGLSLALVGGMLASPANAEPTAPAAPVSDSEFCAGQPMAPVSGLTEGQPVEWLSTVKGTQPSSFTGEYIGKIANGLGYGPNGEARDLLLVKLSSPEVDGTNGSPATGVWAGASGSPVYDANGALIGAVSYGFSWEVDNVAGVTPAEVMRDIGDVPGVVKLDRTARAAVAEAAGAAPTSGLRQLQPVRVTVGSTSEQLDAKSEKIAKKISGFQQVKQSGQSIAGGVNSGEDLPIVPGGNIAVSYAHGAVTSASVGTVTAVCDDEVFAFGHPNAWDSTLVSSFHGASAARIVPDAGSSYKEVESIGRPKGTITEDRLAGIRGSLGQLPQTVKVTTRSSVGEHRSTAVSYVSEKWALSPIAYLQVGNDALRMIDNYEVGSAKVRWKVTYQRANGKVASLTNADRYAENVWFAETVGEDIAMDIAALQANEFETVRVTGVDVTTEFSPEYLAARVAGVQIKTGGKWKSLKNKAVVSAKSGKTYQLRAVLRGAPDAVKGTDYVPFKVRVPKNVNKKLTVQVEGGNGYLYGDLEEEEYCGSSGASDFAGVVKAIDDNERNDRITVATSYTKGKAKKPAAKETRHLAPKALTGGSQTLTFKVTKAKTKKR
ncbi:MAG: hypothetical protein ACK5LO_01510 [Leucobacter sp.]